MSAIRSRDSVDERPTVVLHLGAAKTGTTSLQQFCRTRRTELRDQGWECQMRRSGPVLSANNADNDLLFERFVSHGHEVRSRYQVDQPLPPAPDRSAYVDDVWRRLGPALEAWRTAVADVIQQPRA